MVSVTNQQLGETITCAGLMMGQDVLAALADRELGEIVILPRLMFDHPDGISLDDVHPGQIAKTLDCSVALADLMGDVIDALMGKNALTFTPDGGLVDAGGIVRVGGWAVEKYVKT